MKIIKKPWNFCVTPEEECTMNYCDENGCQNRKRHLVDNEIKEQSTVSARVTCLAIILISMLFFVLTIIFFAKCFAD